MSATARAAGPPERRGGTHRTGSLRTGTYRTGVVRGGAGRTTSARGRSPGHRALSTDAAAVKNTAGTGARSASARSQPSRSVPVRADLRLVPSAPARDRAGRGRSRRLPFVLLVLALLVGTTLSLLVLNTAIAVDSLKATSLRQQNAHREQELQLLQQQVVNGSTVQKLAGEAAKAGLVPAGAAGYLVVEPDGTSTFRGDPAPATPPPAPSPTSPPPGTQPQQATDTQQTTDTPQAGTTGGN